jgi:hypothetical protein
MTSSVVGKVKVKLMQLLKKVAAHTANFIRKLWNFPVDAIFFIRHVFSVWTRNIKMIWNVAEIVEFPQVIMLSVVELYYAIKDAITATAVRIGTRQKVRFQIQSSWIDQIIYGE